MRVLDLPADQTPAQWGQLHGSTFRREIKALAEHFRVTVGALTYGPADTAAASMLAPWCQQVIVAPAGGWRGKLRGVVSLLAGRSVTEGYFRNRRLHRRLVRLARAEPFDVAMAYSSGTLDLLTAVPAGARIMDLVDIDSAKWAGYAESAPLLGQWLHRLEARRVARLERRAVAVCDATLLVSDAEVSAMAAERDSVFAVGNGVDLDYFAPAEPADQQAPSIVFTGTMNYRPNVAGVCWFVREVWPALRSAVPTAKFNVVGRDPSPAVRKLAEAPGVLVTGSVPDVRPYLAAASVAVAPLHIARGVQNKVLEAMAMARPVVASPQALAGLAVQVGSDALQADAPPQWVEILCMLLRDSHRRRELGLAARQCVESRYSWAARMAPLVDLCRSLADQEQQG